MNFLLTLFLLHSLLYGVIVSSTSILQFPYTGTPVNFTVPANVTFMTIDLVGARGGHCSYNGRQDIGGKGGRVQAVLNVTAGMKFLVEVGGKSVTYTDTSCTTANCAGSYGGGGKTQYYYGGPGGGGSYLSLISPFKQLIAAAGGGGGAYCDGDFRCPLNTIGIASTKGGDGGDLQGETVNEYCVGQGGNQTHGGRGGNLENSLYASYIRTYAGSYKKGGDGRFGGGGGGGGYYGGGGGYFGGGGGGSSYVTSSATFHAQKVVHTQGYRDDHGYINIVFDKVAFVDVTLAPSPPPTMTPTIRPITTPTRRPTMGGTSPSLEPSPLPTRRPTQAPVTSNPTLPIMVPVFTPTFAPSTQDDDYTTCRRENLKFFSGEEHDDCLNQIFGEVFTQVHAVTAKMNYMAETFRQFINETKHQKGGASPNVDLNVLSKDSEDKLKTDITANLTTTFKSLVEDRLEPFTEIISHAINNLGANLTQYVDNQVASLTEIIVDNVDNINSLNSNMSEIRESMKQYLIETRYKEPTPLPTLSPSRRRRSRRPTVVESEDPM